MLDGVKRWPAERFAETADALCDRWGANVLLLGGPEDQELARSVAATMWANARVAAGEVSLLTSLALVELADLFVGNDSGLLHAAATLGTPYIGIYGPTSVANFHPVPLYPEQGRLALPPRPCPEPQYFVGGDVVWRHLHCHETCAALLTLPATYVISLAESLLRGRLSSAGAV
jgi:ADP-heptose:LPS heptosyltransferase